MVKVNDISGSLEYSLDQQTDTQKSSASTSKFDSTLMREQLNFQLKGDVFDSRLMSYAVLGGFGLSQQTYNSNISTQSGSSSGDLLEYGFSANFLPTKPYPFSIEAGRSDQLQPRSFQSPLRVKDSHEGFHLSLRVPEWPMTISWTQSELTQDSDAGTDQYSFDRKMERFSYTLTHEFNDYSRFTFRSDIDQVTQTSGIFNSDVKTQRHRFLHYLNFGDNNQHRLNSTFSLLDRDDQFDSSTFDWTENMSLRHSDSFSTFYNTVYSKNTFEEIDTQTVTGLAGFVHQLYLNLVTTGDIYASKSEFGSISETTSQGGDLGFNYRRNNPLGVFLGELEFNYNTDKITGESGTVSVFDELHVFDEDDLLPITLNERNIDTTTIVITNNAGTEIYTEGDDYVIDEVGDEVEITVTTLGVDFPNIVDDQPLLVDYLYELVGEQTEDLIQRKFTLEQQFNNGLAMYLSNRFLDRQVDSDVNSNISDQKTETMIYGAEYQWKRVTFTAEHTDTDSTSQSSESDRLAARSYWPLTPKTSLSGNISQTWIDTSGDNSRQATLFRADGKIRTRLNRYLSLSGRTEYRKEDNSDIGRTNGYRVGASLDFNRASLSVRAGWDTYFLERRNTESESTRFYMNLIRRF